MTCTIVDMNQSDIDIIRSQTHVDDVQLIQECFEKCKGNVVETIMMVSQLQTCRVVEKELSEQEKTMQNIRDIVNEKEHIYHVTMEQMKKINH